MKAFIGHNARLLIVAVLSLLAGLALGLVIGLTHSAEKPQDARVAITDSTQMTRVIHFSSCAHEQSISMDARAYLGYTSEELDAQFPDASILRFDAQEVKLIQVNEGYCPLHYVLQLRGDGSLSVIKTDGTLLTEELVAVIKDEAAILNASAHSGLKNGLAFDSLSEIDTYLESMGS